MKMNWKDVALAYVITIIMLIVVGVAALLTSTYAVLFLFMLIVSVFPGFLYFHRNEQNLTDAVTISAILGFTMIPLHLLALLGTGLIINLLYLGSAPNYVRLAHDLAIGGAVADAVCVAGLFLFGIILSIITLGTYFVEKQFLRKKAVKRKET